MGVAAARIHTTTLAGRWQAIRRFSTSNKLCIAAASQMLLWCTGQRRSKERGEIRTQYHHIADIAPTILEATGVEFS